MQLSCTTDQNQSKIRIVQKFAEELPVAPVISYFLNILVREEPPVRCGEVLPQLSVFILPHIAQFCFQQLSVTFSVTETGSLFAGSKSELISGASSSAVKFC